MRSKTSVWMATVAIAVVAVVTVVFFRSVTIEAVYPIERSRLIWSRHILPLVRGAFHGAKASAENMRLRREIASLALVRSDAERLEIENERLRAELEFVRTSKHRWLAASVISEKGTAGIGKTIRVDRGSLSGVKEQAPVVVREGLVGLVTGVTPHTAEVTLITDPSVRVSCEVAVGGNKRVLGILSGGDENVLMIRYLTRGVEMSPRTPIYTSGKGGVFPRGLEVGSLISVTNQEMEVEGEILPSADFTMLEDVFIRYEK